MIISTNTGKVYRPKDSERLILYLKDVNLPKPDKWGTSQLVAFLQQVIDSLSLLLRLLGTKNMLIPTHAGRYWISHTLLSQVYHFPLYFLFI